MAKVEFRTGDLVAITARVKGLRGDGTLVLDPVGFDFELDSKDGATLDRLDDVEVTLYTVDEPKLIRHGWLRGDVKYEAGGRAWEYHKDLGEGVHLLRDLGGHQYLANAWVPMTTEAVMMLYDEWPVKDPPA